MKQEDIFRSFPFPIFLTDRRGLIVYKNPAAVRYIGTMSKGSHVARYLLDETIPEKAGVVHVMAETPYPHALLVSDDESHLFLCFSRLQYPDYEAAAKQIFCVFGETPAEFSRKLCEFQGEYGKQDLPRRIYTELLNLAKLKYHQAESVYFLGDLVDGFFSRMEKMFRPFGYRIHAEVKEEFLRKFPVCVGRFDLIFTLERMLYLAMKLSEGGNIEFSHLPDEERNRHCFSWYLPKTRNVPKRTELYELFMEVAPECAAELFLMGTAGASSPAQVSVTWDDRGGCRLVYEIPYLSPTLGVRHPMPEEAYASLFAGVFARIEDMLRDTLSSD